MVDISKKDIWWSYLSQFFNIASGVIVLPLVLRMLSTEEIGMNYLMLTIGSLVSLFDFGFAPQFGRNITYVFSGAQELKKEGVGIVGSNAEVNYRLLSTMIHTARFIYRRISLIVLLVMLTLGSYYIYNATDGFSTVENSLVIWLVYSASTYFNIYYSYYISLLTGKGLIMETKKATLYSKLTYILLAASFLFSGMGLLGIALANLISPFISRYLSYRYFFTLELKEKIDVFHISKQEKVDLFKIIWYNSKKLGLVFVGTYVLSKFGIFIAGLYLSLSEIASYGLMMQLIGMLAGIASTLFTIYQPRFSALRVQGNNKSLIREFAFSMNVRYIFYIVGILFLIIIGPWALRIIGSNAELPDVTILSVYSLVILLEANHSGFASFIATKNDIPFVKPTLITAGLIIVGNYFLLEYTNLGVLGLVIMQGLANLAYSNWKWPSVVCTEFNISFRTFLAYGLKETIHRIRLFFDHLHGKYGHEIRKDDPIY